MKAKVTLTLEGVIDLPEVWGEGNEALEVADYHYNNKLNLEDAVNLLLRELKKNCPDLNDLDCEGFYFQSAEEISTERKQAFTEMMKGFYSQALFDYFDSMLRTPHGEYLDLHAERLGLRREPGESDEHLFERCRNTLSVLQEKGE